MTVRIEEWSVCHNKGDSLHSAPETWYPCLHGKVYGHPKKEDGKKVSTSYITKVDGRKITTHSGTVYELGEVDQLYLQHCEKMNWRLPIGDSPITMKVDIPHGCL